MATEGVLIDITKKYTNKIGTKYHRFKIFEDKNYPLNAYYYGNGEELFHEFTREGFYWHGNRNDDRNLIQIIGESMKNVKYRVFNEPNQSEKVAFLKLEQDYEDVNIILTDESGSFKKLICHFREGKLYLNRDIPSDIFETDASGAVFTII